jgi:NarL family two-component system sensor histidine kinase YdfH
VARFQDATALPCVARYDIRTEPSAEIQFEALMIVREALTNVARHASADRVELDFVAEPTGIEVRIEDDGSGFDVGGIAVDSGHYGVLGILERVEKLGGEVFFRNREPLGTLVHVKIGAGDT